MFSLWKKSAHPPPASSPKGTRSIITTFFDFELQSNVLLNTLKSNEIFADTVEYMVQKDACLLVPQSVSLEGIEITPSFVAAHSIAINPFNDTQLVTFAGQYAVFVPYNDEKSIMFVAPEVAPTPIFNPLADFATFFKSSDAQFGQYRVLRSVPVLREGIASMRGRNLYIFIISEPLVREDSVGPEEPLRRSLSSSSAISSSPLKPTALPAPATTSSETSPLPVNREQLMRELTGSLADTPLDTPTATKPAEALQTGAAGAASAASSAKTQPSAAQQTKDALLNKLNQPAAAELSSQIRNFLHKFAERNWKNAEQQRDRLRSFLSAAEEAIAGHPLWRDSSTDELDAAKEALERLVTTKLYSKLFGVWPDTATKDRQLAARISRLRTFVKPSHLEISIPQLDSTPQFDLAKSELVKINTYKAPRDKLICIFNCCKVIYKLLNRAENSAPAGADDFLPLLIYVVLQANPPQLHSNMQFISYFRNPEKMSSEAGYYFTHLISAVTFAEILDPKSLCGMDTEEFNRFMKANEDSNSTSVASIKASPRADATTVPVLAPPPSAQPALAPAPSHSRAVSQDVFLIDFDAAAPAVVPQPTATPVSSVLPSQTADSVAPQLVALPSMTLSTSNTASRSQSAASASAPASAASGSAVPQPPAVASSAAVLTSLPPVSTEASFSFGTSPVPSTSGSLVSPFPQSLGNSAETITSLKPLQAEADFYKMNADDLRLGDVPVLLAHYKKLVDEQKRLQALLDQHKIKH